MKTFKHSGDMGDIIYSLPAIKTMGGGILLLDTTGGEDEYWCKKQCMDGKTKFSKRGFNFLKPLLDVQDYIHECREWTPEDNVDVNLNGFREKFSDPNSRSKNKNLLDLHLDYLDLPEWDPNTPWLTCTEKKVYDKKIVVARSPRYQCNYPWFQSNKFNFRDKGVFIGIPKEHKYFEWTFDVKIDYIDNVDALDMANQIAGCELFVGNSSFPLSLAIGLGFVEIIQEHFPSTIFDGKKNMRYV